MLVEKFRNIELLAKPRDIFGLTMSWLRRIGLFPFSALYGAGAMLRNRLYDASWLRSFAFDFPIIVVGNLQIGGTGKTPCVEYLIRLLSERYQVAVLSRGYGRSSRGYLLAGPEARVEDIGDEPMLLRQLHPSTEIAVAELRVPAIPALLSDCPGTDVILCDDALQHRPLKGTLNVLMTSYDAPYDEDALLPGGRLREPKSGARRAQVIVLSGCPMNLAVEEQERWANRLRVHESQAVFFAGLVYGQPYRLGEPEALLEPVSAEPFRCLLLTGIARAERLVRDVEEGVLSGAPALGPMVLAGHLAFRDHHRWTLADTKLISSTYQKYSEQGPCVILTTEKDAMRLAAFNEELSGLPVYVLPIRMKMLPQSEKKFEQYMFEYVEGFSGAVAGD